VQAAAVLISKFFAEKLELGKLSLADNMQEMLVKVLNVDPTTTILTDESKGYLSRLFSGVTASVRQKYSGRFHSYLAERYPENVRVLMEDIGSESRIGPTGAHLTMSGIAWMRPQQIENAQTYSDVLSMDTTAHKNDVRWPVVLITGRDQENNVVVLLQALIIFETKDSFAWIMQQYHSLAGLPKDWAPIVMFSDDDAGLFGAVTEWSGGRTLALCDDWHHNCNIKARLASSKSAHSCDGGYAALINAFYSCKSRTSTQGFEESWDAYCALVHPEDKELIRYDCI
jgi:hypothetical protein